MDFAEIRNFLSVKNCSLIRSVSTSNNMFRKAICNKLPEYIFKHFEIARVMRGQFLNFQKSQGCFAPQLLKNKFIISKWNISGNQQILTNLTAVITPILVN